jgi:hypothetical protein
MLQPIDDLAIQASAVGGSLFLEFGYERFRNPFDSKTGHYCFHNGCVMEAKRLQLGWQAGMGATMDRYVPEIVVGRDCGSGALGDSGNCTSGELPVRCSNQSGRDTFDTWWVTRAKCHKMGLRPDCDLAKIVDVAGVSR